MSDLLLADISEWQESIDADAYIRGGHGVIIARVHSGYQADKAVPERIAYLRSKPFVAVGWYQYLAPDRDARQQAHEFMGIVGSLRANEFPVLDLEKGAGEQTPRADAWFNVVDPWAGFQASLYSGHAFLITQLGGIKHWGQRPLWIADYVDYTSAAATSQRAATGGSIPIEDATPVCPAPSIARSSTAPRTSFWSVSGRAAHPPSRHHRRALWL